MTFGTDGRVSVIGSRRRKRDKETVNEKKEMKVGYEKNRVEKHKRIKLDPEG